MKQIFVVDDEPDILELSKIVLMQEYDVKTYSSAKNLIDNLENETPDLFIIDLVMPEIDGYELCNILKKKEETANIPIIVFSALGGKETISNALQNGADTYINKPFKTEELTKTVKKLLE